MCSISSKMTEMIAVRAFSAATEPPNWTGLMVQYA